MRGLLRTHRSRGQAITEFALVAPIAMLLILGAFDVSTMATDAGLAVGAARHGARAAALIGGNNHDNANCTGYLTPVLDDTKTSAQDHYVIQSVLAVTGNMNYLGGVTGNAPKGQPEEIIIYRVPVPNPAGAGSQPRADGNIIAGGSTPDHYNRYVYSDSFAAAQAANADSAGGTAHSAYPLSERCQGPLPYDGLVGVRIKWYYKPANGIPGPQFLLTNYAVERMSLCINNCNP